MNHIWIISVMGVPSFKRIVINTELL